MKNIQLSKITNNFEFNALCDYIFSKNGHINIPKDLPKYQQIVDHLRKTPSCIHGSIIDQKQYCYALIYALYNKYIVSVDEFVDLYLKVCIACDYKTKVVTANSLDMSIIDSEEFNNYLKISNIDKFFYNYITFEISAEYLQRDKLVLQELFLNKYEKVPIYGSNIPLSDYKHVGNNIYRIRISSLGLMKLYLKFYYWLPKFYYRFGISTKNDISNGLKDPDNLGRDINIWCPDPSVTNYKEIHGFIATTSMTTLHDIIHINILSSYPKHLPLLVYENVIRMINMYSAPNPWNKCILGWKLVDFSVAYKKYPSHSDINELFAYYIKCVCRSWIEKINTQKLYSNKKKLFSIFFKELLMLVTQNKIWALDGEKIINLLGFDVSVLAPCAEISAKHADYHDHSN